MNTKQHNNTNRSKPKSYFSISDVCPVRNGPIAWPPVSSLFATRHNCTSSGPRAKNTRQCGARPVPVRNGTICLSLSREPFIQTTASRHRISPGSSPAVHPRCVKSDWMNSLSRQSRDRHAYAHTEMSNYSQINVISEPGEAVI